MDPLPPPRCTYCHRTDQVCAPLPLRHWNTCAACCRQHLACSHDTPCTRCEAGAHPCLPSLAKGRPNDAACKTCVEAHVPCSRAVNQPRRPPPPRSRRERRPKNPAATPESDSTSSELSELSPSPSPSRSSPLPSDDSESPLSGRSMSKRPRSSLGAVAPYLPASGGVRTTTTTGSKASDGNKASQGPPKAPAASTGHGQTIDLNEQAKTSALRTTNLPPVSQMPPSLPLAPLSASVQPPPPTTKSATGPANTPASDRPTASGPDPAASPTSPKPPSPKRRRLSPDTAAAKAARGLQCVLVALLGRDEIPLGSEPPELVSLMVDIGRSHLATLAAVERRLDDGTFTEALAAVELAVDLCQRALESGCDESLRRSRRVERYVAKVDVLQRCIEGQGGEAV